MAEQRKDLQPIVQSIPRVVYTPSSSREPTKTSVRKKPVPTAIEELILNDELWSKQPRTQLNIELNRSIIVRGSHIERFLVLTPGTISVERVDKDRVRLTGLNRGTTHLHFWDDRGRWTFYVETIFLLPEEKPIVEPKDTDIESVEPFHFDYSNDWNAYYLGDSMRNLQRRTLNFVQNTAVHGPTPYGYFDTFARFTKFDQSTEVTGYGVGLTGANVDDIHDIAIRGFDVSKRFSDLSLPGKYLRGFLFSSKILDKDLGIDYIRGKDRSVFDFISPGVTKVRESFVEGARLTLFPEEDHQYGLNFARGYGPARESFLKKRVVSVDTRQRFEEFLLQGEVGYDEEALGKLFSTTFGDQRHYLRLNFRDIEKDYVTISNIPADQGEIGGQIIYNLNRESVDVYSFLDIYRDRAFFNPNEPDALNFDYSGTVEIPFNPYSSWRPALFYSDTPELLSPRRNAQISNTYSRRFNLSFDRALATFLTHSSQRSRFAFSPSSEFDRQSVMAGFSIPIIRSLTYFANYEYSWVKETQIGNMSNPSVLNTGFGYSKRITDSWSGNLGLTYRDEEQTEGLHSFLAGEDSVTGNIGLSFHPTSDFEFFVDGRIRNIWRENTERAAFNEGEIRFGVRSSWDLPFRWNPEGYVTGFVFKDLIEIFSSND